MSVTKLLPATLLLFLIVVVWDANSDAGALVEYARYALFAGLAGLTVYLSHLAARAQNDASVLAFPAGAALLVAFLVYVQVSALWSDGLPTALIKSGLIAIAMIVAIATSSVVRRRDIITMTMVACGLFVVVGCVVALAIPSIGVETGWLLEGKWRGISGQKNGFGALAAVTLVGTAILYVGRQGDDGQRRWLWPMLALVFFGFCLVMSGSRGAQMMAAAGLVAALFVRLPRFGQALALILALVALVPLVPLGLLSFSSDQTTLSIFGLSFDTSSRTEIWAYGLRLLGGHELLGFGLSGFWTPARLDVFKAENGWVLDNFHNGYMTVLIEGGLVGIGLLLCAIGVSFFELLRRASLGGREEVFMFSLFAMIALHNMVENDFGRSTNLFFLLFLFSVFSLVFRTTPIPAAEPRVTAEREAPTLTRNQASRPGGRTAGL